MRGLTHTKVRSPKKLIPDKVIQLFWLTKKQWADIDSQYIRMNFYGIKLHLCWEYFDLESPYFYQIMEWCISKDLPIFIHMYSLSDVNKLIKIIKKNPKIKIIVAHLFSFETFLNENKKTLDNIIFDISNTYFISKYRFNNALKTLGCEKMCIGSDTPYGENALSKCINRINELQINQNDKDKILGNNIKSFLKI